MNIVLIGYRGTGKSKIGKRLAKRLSKKFIGMDRIIEKRAGMSISKMVREYGWEKFRNLESNLAEEVGRFDNRVIDTGGGVILRDRNVKSLRKNGKMILLVADIEVIKKRIAKEDGRPSLTGDKSAVDEVEIVLEKRKEKYQKAADFTVDTSGPSTKRVVDEIINYLNNLNKK